MIGSAIAVGLILIALILMYIFDQERQSVGFFMYATILLVLVSIVLGAELSNTFTTKYKVKPIVHIECNGSKCDTTYIYKFK
jgi:hypothetical protein